MITIDPVAVALVPVDSAAADAIGAPNYDEFQSDLEVWDLLRARPLSVLRVTMPHCDVPRAEAIELDGSDASLARAAASMARLSHDPHVRRLRDVLWLCEITRPGHEDAPQLGLGGMARTGEIRTPANPAGTVVRNEGIRESKARGRARLTEVTNADMGTVNICVGDSSGAFQATLEEFAAASSPDIETVDEAGNRHRVWLVKDVAAQERLRALLAREPVGFVADGNHRSAAAAMLGHERYLAVFFPAKTMTIAPYNRLLSAKPVDGVDLQGALRRSFEVEKLDRPGAFQPVATHEIGLYDGSSWWRLRPRPGSFDPADAAQAIDADIVQRKLFADVFGIADARDDRITYVGANRDEAWLQGEVDAGRFRYAMTLAPVTMREFIDVCMQNRFMPPKSTWFVPKVRIGLVMALLESR